jgi:hypothetical protein
MPFNIKVGGVWKPGTGAKVKVGGVWKTVESIQVKVGGVWKVAFTNSISPSITATVTPNPSSFAQDVTISGFVLPVPTGGTVLVRDSGDSPVGTQTSVDTSTGAYSITIPDQGVGTYVFSVNYSGFGLYQPDSTNVTVNVGTIPTTTTITRSAATYQYNQTRITLSGTVSPTPLTGGLVNVTTSSPIGTLGAYSVSEVDGSYSFVVPVKDVGSYTGITAQFIGSGNYAMSFSNSALSYSVTQASTALAASTSSSSVQAGSTVTLYGILNTGSPATALSGRIVTFQGLSSGVWQNLGTGSTNTSGVASFVWTAVAGYSAIRAVYAGETNYVAVTSSGISITVVTNITTTTSIARSAASYAYNGTRVTISGTVSPAPSGGTITISGSIDGATATNFATSVAVNTSTGAYSAVMPVQNAGSYTSVTATYSGSGIYLTSASGTTSYTVDKAATALTATNSFDVNNGTVVTLTSTLTTGGSGFSGQSVTFQVQRKSDDVWVDAVTDTSTLSTGAASANWTTSNLYTHSRAVFTATTNYLGSVSTATAFTTRGIVTTTFRTQNDIDDLAPTSNWFWRGSSSTAQQVGTNITFPAAVTGSNQHAVYRVDIAVSGINGNEGQVRAVLWASGENGLPLTTGATVNLPSRADGSRTRTAFTGTNFPAYAYTPNTLYKVGFWRRGNSTTYNTQWRQNDNTNRTTYWDNTEASPGGFDQNVTYSGASLDMIIYISYYTKNN